MIQSETFPFSLHQQNGKSSRKKWATKGSKMNNCACSGIPISVSSVTAGREEEESQCKINNTRKDIFHDAAHVLGPWIDFFLLLDNTSLNDGKGEKIEILQLLWHVKRTRLELRCGLHRFHPFSLHPWRCLRIYQPPPSERLPPTECDPFNDVGGREREVKVISQSPIFSLQSEKSRIFHKNSPERL